MVKHTYKLLFGLSLLALVSCGQRQFTVEGHIASAEDSVLYLENVGLEGIEVIDSARLTSEGRFSFSHTAPEAPEFYRLRIYDQIINLSIDSTETVGVEATYPQMAAQYEVSGSDNCQKIKELTLLQMQLQQQAIAVERDLSLNGRETRDSLQHIIAAYKEKVKTDYIFKEPYKAYSYFALFQTLGRWLIFDPQSNNDDIKVFAAVATCWDTYYPGALRGENLHNIALEGMRNLRISQAESQRTIDASKVTEAGVIEIQLTDNHGKTQQLTSLKGKVVLLDFHLFTLDDSPQRILMLRELYNKYHARGLEIFQVSFDSDEHRWKQQTAQLPWISVRDEDGLQSDRLIYYNVPTLPEFFLVDRDNNLVKRSGQMTDLDAEIEKLL